jgi:hypothetical protein
MKSLAMATLVAAQLLTAVPAEAAELHSERGPEASQMAGFAGARLRVPLGGGMEKAQAGLALTSTLRSGATGELRFAKGAELGFSGKDATPRVSLAGRPVSKFAPGGAGPNGPKQGFSTLGWVVIGASAVIILGGVLIFDYIGDQSE